MRRNIRLTGRRQLAQSAFDFRLTELNGKKIATLALALPAELKTFPVDAEIRVKLIENKLVEVLNFGTVGRPAATATLMEASFAAPSCQVRVVCRGGAKDGMLLGSTTPWTYSVGGQPDGILLFQPAKIAPRLWKLDIRPEENPILYIDDRVPDAASWAKGNPVFVACVLPHVITEVMRVILANGSRPEDGWMADWLSWLNGLIAGGADKLPFTGTEDEKRGWIDEVSAAFAHKHSLSDPVVDSLEAVR